VKKNRVYAVFAARQGGTTAERHQWKPRQRQEMINCALFFHLLEYAAPAWHHLSDLINRTQAEHLESVQKTGYPYNFQFYTFPNVLFVPNSNHWRLDVITLQDPYFSVFDICKPTSCLHHLIPPPRGTSVTTRLLLN